MAHPRTKAEVCPRFLELFANDGAARGPNLPRHLVEPGHDVVIESDRECLTHLAEVYAVGHRSTTPITASCRVAQRRRASRSRHSPALASAFAPHRRPK